MVETGTGPSKSKAGFQSAFLLLTQDFHQQNHNFLQAILPCLNHSETHPPPNAPYAHVLLQASSVKRSEARKHLLP